MNLNLKLGPLHLSTKPAEILEALRGAKRDYLDPALKLLKEKLNDMIERREAAKRLRLDTEGTPSEECEAVYGGSDFDDAEDVVDAEDAAKDPIDSLEAAAEPDCDD